MSGPPLRARASRPRDADRPAGALRPSGSLIVRSPLLPTEELTALFAASVEASRDLLRSLLARPEVSDALWLSSPSLPVAAYLARDPGAAKAEPALLRFILRMAARPTPYGLFAGLSTGRVAEETELSFAPRSSWRRRTRPDLALLHRQTADAVGDLALAPSAYVRGGELIYSVERPGGEGEYHVFEQVALEFDEPLTAVREILLEGPLSRGLLAARLAAELSADPEEIEAFISSLTEAGALVVLSGPFVTHELPPFQALIEDAERRGLNVAPLRAAFDALAAVDRAGLGAPRALYQPAIEALGGEPADGALFHAELFKPGELRVGPEITRAVLKGAALLLDIAAAPKPTLADRLAVELERRHEAEPVPLLRALDEELGLGHLLFGERASAPWLSGLEFPAGAPAQATVDRAFPELLRALERREEVLELDEALIEACTSAPRTHPGALAAIFALRGAAAGGSGPTEIFLPALVGPSGASWLGRFAALDPALAAVIDEHLGDEDALWPDAILAELVFAPGDRSSNVLGRPVSSRGRRFEIVCHGRSGAGRDRQLPLEDLWLTARDGALSLWSQRHGRRVIPRLTSAHDAELGPPVYRLLAAMTGAHIYRWDFGPFEAASFLPRVRARGVTLSLARWRVTAREVERLRGAPDLELVDRWRRSRGLPQRARLVDGDRSFPLDFGHELSVRAWLDAVKTKAESRLEELFLPLGEGLSGPDGHYAHELVLPLVREAPTSAAITPPVQLSSGAPPPALGPRPPDAEWIYAKLYLGPGEAERFLSGPLEAFLAEHAAQIAGFFFVRYGDPDHHLRLRFRPSAAEDRPRLTRAVLELVSAYARFELLPYRPELERYGGAEAMAWVEQLFSADSRAALDFLSTTPPGELREELRPWVAARSMLRLLDDLELHGQERTSLVESLRRRYRAEHPRDARFDDQLARRFRQQRAQIEALIAGAAPLPELEPSFDRRSLIVHRAYQAVPAALRSAAGSILHLSNDRFFSVALRDQELVLFDLLGRGLRAASARAKGPGC